MKEMTLSHSEPFHFMEFRHGPKSMANEHTLIIALLSEENAAHEQAVLKDMEKQGAQILSLAEIKLRFHLLQTFPKITEMFYIYPSFNSWLLIVQ